MTELRHWAKSLGYRARFDALQKGEDAQVGDPVESPMWYVDYPKSILEPAEGQSAPGRRAELTTLASRVLDWTLDDPRPVENIGEHSSE